MKFYNLNYKKAEKKIEHIAKDIRKHARIPTVKDIFKNQNGETDEKTALKEFRG